MLIAQISDCHVTEEGALVADRVDPMVGLHAATDAIETAAVRPDLVLATGDLTNQGTPAEYDRLVDALARISVPLLVLPGNHDDRTELRRRFAGLPAGDDSEPIRWTTTFEGVRFVVLDTLIPGEHAGRLGADQLAWLDDELAADPSIPTVVVQHHPPILSGIAAMDRYALEDRDAQIELLGRHDGVLALLAGHYHRPIQRTVHGVSMWACPSTAVQLAPRLGPGPATYSSDPAALMLHRVDAGSVTSQVVQLATGDTWVPAWART